MRFTHLAGLGLAMLILTRSASAAGGSSPSTTTGGTSTVSAGSTSTISTKNPADMVIEASQLPEGILRHGEQGIVASAIPRQLRQNAYVDLKAQYDQLVRQSGALAIERAYGALETPIGAARASGYEPYTLVNRYNTLKEKWETVMAPITQWYIAEKAKVKAQYG